MAQPDLLQEASDPSTAPERLRELADHEDDEVQRAAWRNLSLPEEAWREVVMHGAPEAWANPMAPIFLLASTTHKEDTRSAFSAVGKLWETPERCSPEGKVLLNAKVQEGWASCASTSDMMSLLGEWVYVKGDGSVEHREVLRIVILCVRTTPNLTTEDRQTLDLLEAWTAGGQDRRKETEALASSEAVKGTVRFALDPSYPTWEAIRELYKIVTANKQGQERKEASAEHQRRLTNLIRRERPLPPVVA